MKWDQSIELDSDIAEGIESKGELESENYDVDIYQSTLDERITFLTEFVRNTS